MSTLTLENIQKLLQKKKHDASIQQETQQVYTIVKVGEREFPLFVRIYDQGELVQLLAFFPCQLKAETVGDVSRLLHIFNKELDIPGFGMDEVAGVVFFRCMIPMKKNKLDEQLIETFLNTIELACQTFSPTIEAIALGIVNLDEMIRKAQEQAKAKKPS